MSAHLVTPRKIRLSRQVALIPQLGHEHALVALSFSMELGVLAALDARPSVHVWSVEPCDVLLIAPLPAGRFDAVRWLSGQRLAVRQRPDDDATGELWWVRQARAGDRWRPVGALTEAEPSLAEAPDLRHEGGAWRLTERGQERVAIEAEPGPAALDSLGRFVALAQGDAVAVYDADDGQPLQRIEPATQEAPALLDIALTPGGERVITLDAHGTIGSADPMRGGAVQHLAAVGGATCLAIDVQGHVAVGDAGGQITLLTSTSGQRLLRTPKRMRGFNWEVVLPERVGYVGVRPESFGAYLEPEHAIQPVRPLPGLASTVCAGSRWPLLLVGLDDGRLLELDLTSDSVTELVRASSRLHHLAASHFGAVGATRSGGWWSDGEKAVEFALDEPAAVRCVAVERKGGLAAFGYASHIVVLAPGGKLQARVEGIGAPRTMAFVRYRKRRSLVVVDEARVLWRFEISAGKLVRAGVVELDDGLGAPARVDALVADEDDTLRALVELDNGHHALVTIDAQSASAQLLLGVVVYGHHVVAVYDDEGTWLRQDEQRSVRMVSELHAYEPHDWLRRPEPEGT